MHNVVKCNNFAIHELVPKDTYDKYGEFAWTFISPVLVRVLNIIRAHADAPITINNYFWGGPHSYRGLRIAGTKYFTPYSAHSRGCAIDFDIEGMTADEGREFIKKLFKLGYLPTSGLRMETGVSWIHLDVSNCIGVIEFKP